MYLPPEMGRMATTSTSGPTPQFSSSVSAGGGRAVIAIDREEANAFDECLLYLTHAR